MAKARKILKQLGAARNIRTITKTMEMVSSTRFKKSHSQAVSARPYSDRLSDLVGDLMARGGVEKLDHPLMYEPPGVRRDVLMVLTSNRGMCGAYNTAVLRLALERRRQLAGAGYETVLHVSGRRGARSLKFRGFQIEKIYTEFDYLPDYEDVGRLAEELMGEFLAGRIGGVEVAYMQYTSSTRQSPAISQILPMEFLEPPRRFAPSGGEPMKYELHPSAAEILRHLLPATVRLRLWQCFLDAGASEQVVRMTAMRTATDNADEMIRGLTVRYNRMRQSRITAELSEIVGGREGME